MEVKIRFFAKFGEIFGREHLIEVSEEARIIDAIRTVTSRKQDNETVIFDENGQFRSFVIVMKNKARVQHQDTLTMTVSDGDEIVVFPPVAGG